MRCPQPEQFAAHKEPEDLLRQRDPIGPARRPRKVPDFVGKIRSKCVYSLYIVEEKGPTPRNHLQL
jgi:hypothetical protein